MIEKIEAKARQRLAQNDAAHDYLHASRVANLEKRINEHENRDLLIILPASYMHDWCSYGGREYHTSEPAMLEIENALYALDFPKNKIAPVVDAIRHHEDYDFDSEKQELSIECLILQDADRLDALGAIGIARCFYTTGSLGLPLGTPEDMHRLEEMYHNGQLTSAIQHFHTKLLNLKDNMNTAYAKQLAQERHAFMLEFLKRFRFEWNVKK
jgi:uncharacterized protein